MAVSEPGAARVCFPIAAGRVLNTMDEAHRSARRALPLMPEGVFTGWLDPLIDEHGWEPIADPWPRLLLRRRLGFWRSLQWTKETVDIARSRFSAETNFAARGLAMAAFEGVSNELSALAAQSAERLTQIAKLARREGALPGCLVMIQNPGPSGRLEVSDGVRRLAVLIGCQRTEGARCEISSKVAAWVGELPRVVRTTSPRRSSRSGLS